MATTFSINGGTDAAKFTINAVTGDLAFLVAPDFEIPTDSNADNIYQVTVRATDAGGLFDSKTILVTVTDVSESGSLPALTASGSITASANNQIIENKLVTGTITVAGRSGVTIRNCIVNHTNGTGIAISNSTNTLIQDVKVVNVGAPSGQTPNSGEAKNIEVLYGTTVLRRTYVEGACGLYAYQCNSIENYFMEGHNMRGPLSPLRGQLAQYNQCMGPITMEDFSCENDSANSWSADTINLFLCTGGPIAIRRGLLDGNNDPAGDAIMFESTSNGLAEDIDCIHQGNGGPAVYAGGGGGGGASNNMIYRRCNVKDTLQFDQGRGPATSGYTTFVSSPGCSNTHFEQCKYFNVNLSSLAWDPATMTVMDWSNTNFTPRAPIRNRTPGT